MLDIQMRIVGDYSTDGLMRQFGIEDHGPVQQAIDRATITYMEAYWAYDTGRLATSAWASDIGSGIIEYDTPYASEMYYGVRANGKPVNYHLDKNPLAGAYPWERMMADHYDDILEVAKTVAYRKQH